MHHYESVSIIVIKWLYNILNETNPCDNFLNGGVMTAPNPITHCLPTLILARSPLMMQPVRTIVCIQFKASKFWKNASIVRQSLKDRWFIETDVHMEILPIQLTSGGAPPPITRECKHYGGGASRTYDTCMQLGCAIAPKYILLRKMQALRGRSLENVPTIHRFTITLTSGGLHPQ